MQEERAGLVVHLVADDRGVVGVPRDDCPDDALRVVPEQGVRDVDLLARSPGMAHPGGLLAREVGIHCAQPRGHGIGRRAEHNRDAAGVRTVEHGLQPVEVIHARLWLPGRPHRLANANDREGCLGHQVEVALEVTVHAVLVVERRSEQDPVG